MAQQYANSGNLFSIAITMDVGLHMFNFTINDHTSLQRFIVR